MVIHIKDEQELERKIHHFIENLVTETGYVLMAYSIDIVVE